MWPLATYPEASPQQVDGKTYDYVIVGGGTAGCALASRLSEDHNVSVLLIERGHVKNNVVSRMPVLSQNMWWTDLLQVQSTIWSEPIHDANERSNRLWAVNGVGGASRLNAMLWTRGSPGDYSAWGMEDWTWEKVEPYFKKLENVTWLPNKPLSKVRGYGGPIDLCKPRYPFKWPKYLKKAAENIGLKAISDDCNDPRAPSCGYFTLETAIDKNGERVSALSAYLNKAVALSRKERLTVCTGAVASRLEIVSGGRDIHTITGVYIRSPSGSNPTRDYLVKARREVILTCGAMTTPQLLLLSGIGPTRLSPPDPGLDIPLVKELPAVGANFSDHYSIPVMLELPSKETLHFLETAMWGLWYILIWIFTGKGLMSVSSAPAAMFFHTNSVKEDSMEIMAPDTSTSNRPQVPNVEIMIIPLNSLERAVPGRSLFSIYPTIVQPRAKGRVEICSTDPMVNPKITHPMFGHIEDLKVARLAVRMSMRLAEEFQNLYPFSAPFAFAPGNELHALSEWEKSVEAKSSPVETPISQSPKLSKTWKDVTDDEIDDYMRRVAHTALHFSSTCPMGMDEKNSVVDQKLLVFGFSNLRIADASIFPKVPSAHTMAPVLMVAERCADFIKSTWNSSQD